MNAPEPASWLNVEIENTGLLERCLTVLRKMSSRYNAIGLNDRVRPWMAAEGGTVAYYQDAAYEIVLPFAYSARHRMYDIASFGFLSGNVQGVMDLALAKLRHVIEASGESRTVFSTVPTSFDYPGMSQFLNLLPAQPGVQVVVRSIASDIAIWRITV